MVLVNIKHKEVLEMLQKDLLKSIGNDHFVNVHIHAGTMQISHCVIPDDIIIDTHNIVVTQGNFDLIIDLENVHMFEIQHSEIENGYHIQCDDINVYIDFNE